MTQISVIYIELTKKLQEGIYKMNTEFIHRDLSTFTDTIDTNVLNDYLIIGEVQEKNIGFGRWKNGKIFDFERYAASLICELSSESLKANQSIENLKRIVNELVGINEFMLDCYRIIASIAEIYLKFKNSEWDQAEILMPHTIELVNMLKTHLKEINLFKKFTAKEAFEYVGFVDNLKQIAFVINSFVPVVIFLLNFAKVLIPDKNKTKKGKKTSIPAVVDHLKLIISNLFSFLDDIFSYLQNEEFLEYIDKDEKAVSDLQEITLAEINKEEKKNEIIQARRILIKEIGSELHSVKAAGLILLR